MTEPNLRRLKATRKKPSIGDLFVLSPLRGLFLFGRVICADLPRDRAPMPGSNLVYIYRGLSDHLQHQAADLRPERLLLPPLFTNRMPWTKGYFQTVGSWPLTGGDLVKKHCFLSPGSGRYHDLDGRELPGPIEPCGDWALHSFRTIDDEISDALGIERAPI